MEEREHSRQHNHRRAAAHPENQIEDKGTETIMPPPVQMIAIGSELNLDQSNDRLAGPNKIDLGLESDEKNKKDEVSQLMTANSGPPEEPNTNDPSGIGHNLPAQLQQNLESTSGYDMSDVRVHYNSSQPAQLSALAYAQGNQIHLGPGQEQHLGHEAWHVVQQKQGRVRATTEVNGSSINDSPSLENEADRMGGQVMQAKMSPDVARSETVPPATAIVQRVEMSAEEMLRVGSNYYQNGNYQRALTFFQRFIHADGVSQSAQIDAIYNIGLCNLHLRRFGAAINFFEIYLRRYPENTEAQSSLEQARRGANAPNAEGEITGELNPSSEASSSEMRSDSSSEASTSSEGTEGQLQLPENPYGQTESHDDVTSELPQDSETGETDQIQRLYQRAVRQYTNGDWRSALYLFEQCRQAGNLSRDQNTDILYNIGRCNMQMGRYATAITYLEQYLAQNPGNQEAQEHLNECARRTGIRTGGEDSSEPVQPKMIRNSSGNAPIQRWVDLQGQSPESERTSSESTSETSQDQETTGPGAGESATIELPLECGSASTRGELRTALLAYRLRFLDLIARLESREGSQFDLQSLREVEQRQLRSSEQFNTGDSSASLQPMEVGIIRIHFPNETRHYQNGLNEITRPVSSALRTIQNSSRPSAMTEEIAEARRLAFENNDSERLTALQELSGNINSYTSRLDSLISFAAEHNSRIAGARLVNQVYGISSRISGFTEKIGHVFTAMEILNNQADGGGTSGAQATLQTAQTALTGMDTAMSFVEGVPLLGSLWSNYYQPAASACLEGLQRIVQSRAGDVITGIRSRYDWTSSTPPQFDGNDSRFINGGREQVFPFLWRIFFGNYQYLRSVEEYFIDHESQFTAGLGAPMSITNRYIPLVDSHIENFEAWATENRRDLWILLYGAQMPFPGSTSVAGSMREYNQEEF